MLVTTLVLSAATLSPQAPAEAASQDGPKRITLEQTSRRPKSQPISLSPSLPRVRWAPDGEHVAVGRGDEVRWFDVRTGEFEKPAEEAKGGMVEDPGGQAAIEELAGMIQGQGSRSERQAEKIAKSLTRKRSTSARSRS